jgi:hypothetical protein
VKTEKGTMKRCIMTEASKVSGRARRNQEELHPDKFPQGIRVRVRKSLIRAASRQARESNYG